MDTSRNQRILVVDDEAPIRHTLRIDLERCGYEVLTAASGHEAFDVVCASSVDLVITDIKMPNGNGIELLKRIKARDAAWPKVVLMTAFVGLATEEVYHFGAEAILAKPFDDETLVPTVRKVLQNDDARWSETIAPSPDTSTLVVAGSEAAIGTGGAFLPILRDFPQCGVLSEFKITSRDLEDELRGVGLVRWVRPIEGRGLRQGVGLEFVALEQVSRKRMLRYIRQIKPQAYIPIGSAHANGEAPVRDSRKDPRESTRTMPGQLLAQEGTHAVRCDPVDVSARGFGGKVDRYLLPGSVVLLEVGPKTVALEVVYCHADFNEAEAYRAGFACTEVGVDLLRIFREAGCLDLGIGQKMTL